MQQCFELMPEFESDQRQQSEMLKFAIKPKSHTYDLQQLISLTFITILYARFLNKWFCEVTFIVDGATSLSL